MLWAALDTGARRYELMALEWSDYDTRRGTLAFTKALVRPRGGGFRLAPLKTKASRRVLRIGLGCRMALDALERRGH